MERLTMNNKTIYLVCTGHYSDIDWHGYFETEKEAKDYCGWKNSYMHDDDWERYWYSKVALMNIQKEKEATKVVYSVRTNKFLIDTIEAELQHKSSKNSHYMEYYPKGYFHENEEESYSFIFYIETTSEDEARKIAYKLMAEVKEKYVECEDWDMAMEYIGGYLF